MYPVSSAFGRYGEPAAVLSSPMGSDGGLHHSSSRLYPADTSYNRWERDHVLSFIPPDGKFKLLEYETATSPKMPFTLKAGLQIDDAGGRFSLTLASRVPRLEDVVVSIFLGSTTTGISATPAGDRQPSQDGAANGHVGGGTCEFDPHTQVLRWTLSSLVQHERSPTLTGSLVS